MCIACVSLTVGTPLTKLEQRSLRLVLRKMRLPEQPWYVQAGRGRLSVRELRRAMPGRWRAVDDAFIQNERKFGITSYSFSLPDPNGHRIVFVVRTDSLGHVNRWGSTQRFTCFLQDGRLRIRVKVVSRWIAEDIRTGNDPEPKPTPENEEPPPRAKPLPTITPAQESRTNRNPEDRLDMS